MRRTLPSWADGTQASGLLHHAFYRELDAVRELRPASEKNLIPLSSKGLCEALITMPADRRSARVRYATAGVGSGPDR
jgi:hypothetical protein